MNPKVIILSGIPAAGKSTWSRDYFNCNSWNTRIISRDDIRELAFLFPQPYQYNKSNEDRVTEHFNSMISSAAALKKDIVLDNTHCKEKYIDDQIKYFREKYPEYTVYIKFFDIPLWKSLYRDWRRDVKTGKHIPFSVIRQMLKCYKKINKRKYGIMVL